MHPRRRFRQQARRCGRELLAPFAYDYMFKAMWVSALVGGLCAFLSAYLMLKGWSPLAMRWRIPCVPGVAIALR